MTVSSSNRRAGPFAGNGVTVAFPFTFKVFSAADVAVYFTDAGGTQSLLGGNYTVTLNPDQDASPGGTLNYPTVGGPLAIGTSLDLLGDVAFTQATDLTNLGRYLPQVVENALDKITILIQQLKEKAARTLTFPVGDTAAAALPSKAQRIGALLAFDENGAPAVGPNIAAVGTVTANVAAINAVGGSIASVNTVAGAVANVNAVAGNAANVNLVGGSIANVNNVGANIASVNTTAGAIAQVIDAPNQATIASAASAVAVAARDAALGASRMYATTAAALADGTLAVNAYFTTPSTVLGEAAILYQKIAGPASVDTGVRLPSTAFVPQFLPPESGYQWALLDANGFAAMAVDATGKVTVFKALGMPVGAITTTELASSINDVLPQVLVSDSGYQWAVLDSAGRAAITVDLAGAVSLKLTAAAAAAALATTGVSGPQYVNPSKNLVYAGDSLTAGAGGQTTWREYLQAQLVTRTHTSYAIGGQTSSQIAARLGAYLALLTIAGNQIPANGAVAVTVRTISLLTDQGAQSIVGTLWGVPGTLARAGDDSYSFTRTTNGVAVKVGVNVPFMPSIGTDDFSTLMICVGRNNLNDVASVQRDIAALVALQKTAEKRFMILTPTNGGSIAAGVATNEGTGSGVLTAIKQIEDWAVQNYGDRVLKLREFSFQFNNGTADDLDDVAKETVPRSLRIDAIHWTTAFHTQVGTWALAEINRRGW